MNSKTITKLKKLLLLSAMLLNVSLTFAQMETETAKPLTDMEIVREVAYLDLEGKTYENVTISFKSKTPDYFISSSYRVKVKVVDKNGKYVYKNTFKNVFLYVFSNGQIQVGKKNFNQIIVQKSNILDKNIAIIREKEGIY